LTKEEDDKDADDEPNGDMMELFNFDIDIDSLWAYKITKPEGRESNSTSDSGSRSVHLEKFKGKIVDPLVRVRFIAAAVIPMNKTTVPSWEPPRPAGHAHVGFAHWYSVVQSWWCCISILYTKLWQMQLVNSAHTTSSDPIRPDLIPFSFTYVNQLTRCLWQPPL
jgi:hypothetical protein